MRRSSCIRWLWAKKPDYEETALCAEFYHFLNMKMEMNDINAPRGCRHTLEKRHRKGHGCPDGYFVRTQAERFGVSEGRHPDFIAQGGQSGRECRFPDSSARGMILGMLTLAWAGFRTTNYHGVTGDCSVNKTFWWDELGRNAVAMLAVIRSCVPQSGGCGGVYAGVLSRKTPGPVKHCKTAIVAKNPAIIREDPPDFNIAWVHPCGKISTAIWTRRAEYERVKHGRQRVGNCARRGYHRRDLKIAAQQSPKRCDKSGTLVVPPMGGTRGRGTDNQFYPTHTHQSKKFTDEVACILGAFV
ncbi:hypothetical protein BDY19DRAFT_907865 [Irpex rosettiformis]|uniref:Uncharacterized protein n=1 Tax=Irpex rosettiformis TaxID=378272 RepID=A0ACB8TYA9_9APHY|nr:hypothetical protein BDY19DRAFT_907865 [Irpex rosettiformis]